MWCLKAKEIQKTHCIPFSDKASSQNNMWHSQYLRTISKHTSKPDHFKIGWPVLVDSAGIVAIWVRKFSLSYFGRD